MSDEEAARDARGCNLELISVMEIFSKSHNNDIEALMYTTSWVGKNVDKWYAGHEIANAIKSVLTSRDLELNDWCRMTDDTLYRMCQVLVKPESNLH